MKQRVVNGKGEMREMNWPDLPMSPTCLECGKPLTPGDREASPAWNYHLQCYLDKQQKAVKEMREKRSDQESQSKHENE